jgi:2',3'-cyclic-nucleotide 2'-phosphodiesterase (5'-nucleotidase family)
VSEKENMKPRKYGWFAAASILASVVMPAWLNAQITGDTQITILQTTDLHHHANGADHVGLDANQISGMSPVGAYARISAYVNHVRAVTNHPVILVDSGDWTMGTLYDLTLGSRPLALAFLDLLRYDCVTLGNHEFDYTPKGLAQILGTAQSSFGFRTPIVASNVILGGNTDLGLFVGDGKAIQITRVQELPNGLKIGYIGLMGKAAALAAQSAPVTFLDVSTRYAAVQDLVDGLRNTQGVHVVVALSHSGTDAAGAAGEDVELATHVRGIDVIASGHTHTPLAAATAVANAGWTTQIINAGAFGTNVTRIDLTYHPSTRSTTRDNSSNPAMTDAGLAAIQAGLVPDAAIASLMGSTDQQLNIALGAYFTQTFPDYDRASLAKGIYHPVGSTTQDMVSNVLDPVPSPNGLGNLAADAVRSVPNIIVAQTLIGAGGNPANLPGYDFTPFQAGVVATAILRGKLQMGVPLSFADVYNVLPLGISPDSSQALPVGYPLMSAYMDLADVKKLCALQLVAQTKLAPSDYYLNLSGIRYDLKSAELYAYFKYATAAGVLQVASQKAAAGSTSALGALGALSTLAKDSGAALLGAYGGGNPYAGAMVKLNDANPSNDQIVVNLGVLAQVAAAAAADATAGSNTLGALVVSKAIAAIGTVAGFAVSDGANTGPAIELPATARVRLATDLFAILALGVVQVQFGTTITTYKSATGPATLSGADIAGLLANRIDADPSTAGVQELKEWMTLLSYLGAGLKGTISSAYASTGDFAQFGGFGVAVQTRNANYPIAAIGQLAGTLGGLQGAPPCNSTSTPVVAAVTNETYGGSISATGTMIVWGAGFSPGGGNAINLTREGSPDSIMLDAGSGSYFWDLSANQINAAAAGKIVAGRWLLSVRNACGAASPNFAVTIQ